MALPDFFVAGVPKAGTTAVHAALARHPALYMSTVKEPKFFLTDREAEILRLVAKGLTYPQIAQRLTLSTRTVQNHVQNTLSKLQLHNKAQLVRYALEQGVD